MTHERSGVFRLLQTGIETLKAIGESFTEDDLKQIRTGLVRLTGTLKQVCRPEALELIERAAQLPGRLDWPAARAVGPWGLFWALGNDDIKQGLGVLLELTRGLATLKPPLPE